MLESISVNETQISGKLSKLESLILEISDNNRKNENQLILSTTNLGKNVQVI